MQHRAHEALLEAERLVLAIEDMIRTRGERSTGRVQRGGPKEQHTDRHPGEAQ